VTIWLYPVQYDTPFPATNTVTIASSLSTPHPQKCKLGLDNLSKQFGMPSPLQVPASPASDVLEKIQSVTSAQLTEEARAAAATTGEPQKDKGGAEMFKQYAQDAKAHGRSAGVDDDNDSVEKDENPDATADLGGHNPQHQGVDKLRMAGKIVGRMVVEAQAQMNTGEEVANEAEWDDFHPDEADPADVFRSIDLDCNGYVTVAELRQGVRQELLYSALGLDNASKNLNQTVKFFEMNDRDDSHQVDLNEFTELCQMLIKKAAGSESEGTANLESSDVKQDQPEEAAKWAQPSEGQQGKAEEMEATLPASPASDVLEKIQSATSAKLTEEAQAAAATTEEPQKDEGGAEMFKQYAQDAKAHGRSAGVDHLEGIKDTEETPASPEPPQDSQPSAASVPETLESIQRSTSARLTEEVPEIETGEERQQQDEGGAAEMFKKYAQNAEAHGRAAGGSQEEEDDNDEENTEKIEADGEETKENTTNRTALSEEEAAEKEEEERIAQEEFERSAWLTKHPLVFEVDENESDVIFKEIERTSMAMWEKTAFAFIAELRDEVDDEVAEEKMMLTEDQYVNKMLVGKARVAYFALKERDLMASELCMRKALLVMRNCRAQAAEHEEHFKKMDDASTQLELAAHKRVLSMIQKQYQKKGMSDLYPKGEGQRHPDNVTAKLANSSPLRKLPQKKDNVYAFRKYVYAGREEMKPIARPLDEGFEIQDLSPPKEDQAGEEEVPPELKYMFGSVPLKTDVMLELAVDPASLDPKKQEDFLAAVAKEAKCHPSQLIVRTVKQRIVDEVPCWFKLGGPGD